MDRAQLDLQPLSDQDKVFHIAYKDRWDYLKPIIVQLYTGNYGSGLRKTATLAQVVEFMKKNYSFHATPTQYRNHFRAWKIDKRLVGDEKDAIASALGRRKRPGASTSQANVQQDDHNKAVDTNKLARYIKGKMANRHIETFAPGLFTLWNRPYAALISSLPQDPNAASPFGPGGATPEYLNIRGPEALTPGREAAGPSPNMELVYEYTRQQHTSLFLQGRFKDLLVSMCTDQRRMLVDHFYKIYVHSLVAAKRWNREVFNTSQAEAFVLTTLLRNTPNHSSPGFYDPPSPAFFEGISRRADNIPVPTKLCRWSIHVTSMDSDSFVESMHQSIANTPFPSTPQLEFPIAHESMVQSLEKDSANLKTDALKLAIIAGNCELIEDLFTEEDDYPPGGIDSIYPFQLAAAYLDGGHSCCNTFIMLYRKLGQSYAFHHNTDSLGHTILDALIVSVLRSHTTISPDDVSFGFRSPNLFPGEEQDICGRWDVEATELHHLFRNGSARIPTGWKHPFCHTAAQTVCHSIITVFASPVSPNIDAQSGLFIRRCTECGLELRLGPLHTLVVTTFYLAELGMDGETLFGAIAVLVSLLAVGVDVCHKANISVEEILRDAAPDKCHHMPLSPLELMRAVPDNIMERWTPDCQTGWICFRQVLIHAETDKNWMPRIVESDGSSASSIIKPDETSNLHFENTSSHQERCQFENYHHNWLHIPCNGPEFGILWATIQTELLTYRRLRGGDPWVSENFSMTALKAWLEGKSETFLTALIQHEMTEKHSPCGWFCDSISPLCPTSKEICKFHFMNMDLYERTSFIESMDVREYW
ncbi:hypothetical protein HJFPF1_13127 [Paramyrothecium foliicola]|nr:hypothetical protein HJFPF1_13127 [Paramyrothecium foliicola]